jgi:hypothetical protein
MPELEMGQPEVGRPRGAPCVLDYIEWAAMPEHVRRLAERVLGGGEGMASPAEIRAAYKAGAEHALDEIDFNHPHITDRDADEWWRDHVGAERRKRGLS